jgi:hypothetical protein
MVGIARVWGVRLWSPVMHQHDRSPALPCLVASMCRNSITIEACTSLNSCNFLFNFVALNLNWCNELYYFHNYLYSYELSCVIVCDWYRSLISYYISCFQSIAKVYSLLSSLNSSFILWDSIKAHDLLNYGGNKCNHASDIEFQWLTFKSLIDYSI